MENQPQADPKGSKSTMWIIILVVVIILAGGAYYFLSQDNGKNTNNTNNANAVVNSVSNANENINAVLNANTNEGTNENTNVTVHDELNYTNEQYGFSLTFPEDWKGYTTEVWDGYYNDPENVTDHVFIVFTHPQRFSSDGQPGEVGFKIAITTNPNVEIYPYFNLIETSPSGVRYSYRTGNGAAPGDLQQYADQVLSIIQTFQLVAP